MALKGMHLAWITVSDLDKAEQFFERSIGLRLEVSDKEHGWLEFSAEGSGMRLGVTTVQQDGCCGGAAAPRPDACNNGGPGCNAVVTIDVDDIAKTKIEFESRGVQFTSPIMELPGHIKLASFVDFDGNRFQLVEMIG